MNQIPLSTIDLFAGAGLLSHAFHEFGCRTVLAVEADARAAGTFEKNLGASAFASDARRVTTGINCRILLAGPPCQGFSSLGKRDASDERNSLSLCVSDWAKASSPSVVLVENVPQFLKSPQWRLLVRRMRRQGYETTQWVLNAADFGAPQLRTRAFGIFSKIGLPSPPVPLTSRYVTVREAFFGLNDEPAEAGMHVAPTPGKLALARFKVIPSNGDKRDVMRDAPRLCPPSWLRMGSQATDVWGRLDPDAPSNTVRCCFQNASKGRYVHPSANRVLTLREGARLQGVPDDWEFVGDRSSVARQIGNGVPIALGKAVASRIVDMFSDE